MEALSFNQRIKAIVDRFGAKKITENTSISTSQIHHLKTKGESTGKNIRDIAKATGTNPLWLLTGEGPMIEGEEPSTNDHSEFTNDELEMINLFRTASLQAKLKAVQVLNEG